MNEEEEVPEWLQGNTVTNAMIACGVPNTTLFNGDSTARRIAVDIFDDSFETCIDKTVEELNSDLKDYSVLTVNQGQIRLNPATKRSIRAFIQWCKDKYRLNEDPSAMPFPNEDTPLLIQRYNTHKAFVEKSKTISDTATPIQFTHKVKWIDWQPTFINFLRAIPGRNGLPLSYICRPETIIPQNPYTNFIEEYIDKAPLHGNAFVTDSAEVYTYMVKFISHSNILLFCYICTMPARIIHE
jgi:hypothetical protein